MFTTLHIRIRFLQLLIHPIIITIRIIQIGMVMLLEGGTITTLLLIPPLIMQQPNITLQRSFPQQGTMQVDTPQRHTMGGLITTIPTIITVVISITPTMMAHMVARITGTLTGGMLTFS